MAIKKIKESIQKAKMDQCLMRRKKEVLSIPNPA
jgi:hypothetical protein